MKKQLQMSETLLVGTLLALVGGFLDAYTYICRGGVFANAQTGNMVFFGIKAAHGDWLGALSYLVPIFCFFAGIIVAELVKAQFKSSEIFHWRQITIAIELAVLALVPFIPDSQNLVANALVSFVCSVQVQAFRKLNGFVYATTMCTGNLRSATERLMIYLRTHDKSELQGCLRYFAIIAVFVIGAAVGTLLTTLLGALALYLCCAALLVTLIIMFIK